MDPYLTLNQLVGSISTLMRKIRLLYSIILLTSRRGKRKITLNCTKKDLIYLSLLKSTNILEYSKVPFTLNKYDIIISYCNGKPVLNNITSIDLAQKGPVSLKNWTKETNSRKALYLAYTATGVKLVDNSTSLNNPTRLLFKIEFN
jgi:hypothetical protein